MPRQRRRTSNKKAKTKSKRTPQPQSPEAKFSKYLHKDKSKQAIVEITNPDDVWYGKTGIIRGCTPTRLIISMDHGNGAKVYKDDKGNYQIAPPIVEEITRIPENFRVLYWPPHD